MGDGSGSRRGFEGLIVTRPGPATLTLWFSSGLLGVDEPMPQAGTTELKFEPPLWDY